MASIYDFKMKDIKGQERSLSDFRGQVLLLVNVASKCGLTPQYKGLEELYEKYRERGFAVLGFPSNDFAGQEPGTEREIQDFCDLNYKVQFPLFSKIAVKGESQDPLYKYLTQSSAHPGEIQWNFQKFLINKKGEVVANIGPKTEPREIDSQIEKLLQE
jgi:glutathione peroxidase